MEVKGTGLITTKNFVKTKFPEKFDLWFNSLPEVSKKFYEDVIDATKWYPIKESYLDPMDHIVKIFYNGNKAIGGDELGRYSAEVALTGVYKVFLLITSPTYLMKRGTKIFTTFYNPSELSVIEVSPTSAIVKISKFDELTETMEYRIAGWICRASEMANCKGIKYKIEKSLLRGDNSTEILYTWEG